MEHTQTIEEKSADSDGSDDSLKADRPNLSEKSDELRIVLLGKTGVGKSASGNTILGREEFKSCFASTAVTRVCMKARAEVGGREVSIIDTPSLFDTGYGNEELSKEIANCIPLSSPGPHAFLLVIQLGRFTHEEKATVKMIQETFGTEAAKYTMVLFTHGDRLKNINIETFIRESNELQKFTAQFQGGYHVFNNEDPMNHTQVTELLQKIDKMVCMAKGDFYTNEMYQQAKAGIKKRKWGILKKTKKNRNMKSMKWMLQIEMQRQLEKIKMEFEMQRQLEQALLPFEIQYQSEQVMMQFEQQKRRDEEVRMQIEEQRQLEKHGEEVIGGEEKSIGDGD